MTRQRVLQRKFEDRNKEMFIITRGIIRLLRCIPLLMIMRVIMPPRWWISFYNFVKITSSVQNNSNQKYSYIALS